MSDKPSNNSYIIHLINWVKEKFLEQTKRSLVTFLKNDRFFIVIVFIDFIVVIYHVYPIKFTVLKIFSSTEFIQTGLQSEDYGQHLLGVEDLLQKHSLVEADITAQAERVSKSKQDAEDFLEKAGQDETDGIIHLIQLSKKIFYFQ